MNDTITQTQEAKEDEIWVALPKGGYLVFQDAETNPVGTEYVRIVNDKGVEAVYWDQQEWAEDPQGVMGAIMGAIYIGGNEAYRDVYNLPDGPTVRGETI